MFPPLGWGRSPGPECHRLVPLRDATNAAVPVPVSSRLDPITIFTSTIVCWTVEECSAIFAESNCFLAHYDGSEIWSRQSSTRHRACNLQPMTYTAFSFQIIGIFHPARNMTPCQYEHEWSQECFNIFLLKVMCCYTDYNGSMTTIFVAKCFHSHWGFVFVMVFHTLWCTVSIWNFWSWIK